MFSGSLLFIRSNYDSTINTFKHINNDPKLFITLGCENIQFKFYSTLSYAQLKYRPSSSVMETYALNNYTTSTGFSAVDDYFITTVTPRNNNMGVKEKSIKLPNILSAKSPLLEVFSIIGLPIAKVVIVLCFFLMLCNVYQKYAPQTIKNFFNFISTLIINCISYYEVVSVLSAFVLLVILTISISVNNDDFFDAFIFMILLLVFSTTILFFINVGFIRSYYILNSNSNGQTIKRSVFDDIVNTLLCILRIFLCWSRYVFYDLQVEFVDIALNYTEDLDFDNYDGLSTDTLIEVVLSKILDVFMVLVSLVICLIKFTISLFLMWLIVDLFLLRIGSKINEDWLIKTIIDIIKKEYNKILK